MTTLSGLFQVTVALPGTFQTVVGLAGRVGRFVTGVFVPGTRLDFSDPDNSGHIGSI